ncbi:MAG: hypothetical protein JO347_03750, partial [Candidatus Eremiobacteraeota bacterium]|nr:hypothetical protein [Candidatus Eremiobacteraeota bacterium]
LVVTAITLIGDAVSVITSFLTGDLTSRFLLQALVLLFIAGGVFWYYLGTVRSNAPNPMRDRWFGVAAAVVVCAFVVMGFLLTGSPSRIRAREMDNTRLQRLSEISYELHQRVAPKPEGEGLKLPTSLDQVLSLSRNDTVDPITDKPFEYIPAAVGTKYELCATFDDSGSSPNAAAIWTHPAGHHCFQLDAAAPAERYYNYYNRYGDIHNRHVVQLGHT